MNQMLELFEEFLIKAIVTTEEILKKDLTNDVNLEGFTDNRDRLFSILDQISKGIDWNMVENERKIEINKQIEFIKKLDDTLLAKLHEFQSNLKREIEQTVRQKDNIKGYNLSDVK
jgi:hypothetical protein